MEEHGETRCRRDFRDGSCTHAGGDCNKLHSDTACCRGPEDQDQGFETGDAGQPTSAKRHLQHGSSCPLSSHAPADAGAAEWTSSRLRPGSGARNWGRLTTYFCKTSIHCFDDSHSAHQCQSLQTSLIRQLSESCSAPPAREHFSETRARNSPLTLASPEETILRQHKLPSQSPSRQACSCSSRGSGSFISFLLALVMFFFSTLVPTAMAAVANVELIPSGVLEMTVTWTDSPQTGVM